MSLPIPDHPKIKLDKSGALLLNFGEYGGEVELACFSPCGSRLLTVQEVGTARIWDVKDGKLAGEISPQSPLAGRTGVGPTTSPFRVFIESVALAPKGEIALLGLNDGTAGLFRVSDGSRLSLFHEPSSPPARTWGVIRAVAFSPDGALAVVGFSRQTTGDRPCSALRGQASRDANHRRFCTRGELGRQSFPVDISEVVLRSRD